MFAKNVIDMGAGPYTYPYPYGLSLHLKNRIKICTIIQKYSRQVIYASPSIEFWDREPLRWDWV